MKQARRTTALLLALLLGLTACQTGGDREVRKVDWVNAPAYLAEEIPLPVRTGGLTGCCTDGAYLYFLADERTEDKVRSVLVRADLAGGTAEALEQYQPPESDIEEYYCLGPVLAPDGTLWLYEAYTIKYYDLPEDYDPEREARMKYCTGQDDFYHLRQLDPATGKQKKLVDLSDAVRTLDMESIYRVDGFAVDGGGNLYFAADGSVTVSSGRGEHLFTLEASIPARLSASSGTAGSSLALLPDGTAAVLTTLPGGRREVRTIDPAAGDWGEARYELPAGVELLYSGTGGFLFFFTQGSELYAWEPESGSPRRLLSWSDTGLTGSAMCFAPLDGGRLAALTLRYTAPAADGWYEGQLRLALLSPGSRDPGAGKVRLVCGAILADSKLRGRIDQFNRESGEYIIELRDYAGEGVDANSIPYEEYDAVRDAAYLRLRAEVAAGRVPDIWDVSLEPDRTLYARRGYLEDLWPWIDGDEELGGREALMSHALECAAIDGRLYQAAPAFQIATMAASADLVGDRAGWTLEELLECWRRMPEGSRIMEPFWDGAMMLSILIQYDDGRWVDWASGTCRFDSREFKDLLELCRQADEGSDPNYVLDRASVGLREGRYLMEQVFLDHPQQLVYYEALFSRPEDLWDYEAYLNENHIYSSLTDGSGAYRESGSAVSYALAFAEACRKEGVCGSYPLASGAAFGALRGGGHAAYVGRPSQDRTGNRILLTGGVSMSAACRDKEGAWSFIRRYLLPGAADPAGKGRSEMNLDREPGFPVNRADFAEFLSPQWFTDSEGAFLLDGDGKRIENAEVPVPIPGAGRGETVTAMVVYELFDNEELMEQFLALYNSAVPAQHIGPELLGIIREQAGAYFAGDKTLDETAALIQNRASLYVNENR